jgi:glutamate dehydrogenase (NAD(P)+)
MKALGLSVGLSGKRVVVQALGNVGYNAAKALQDSGAIIVGVAEREGAVYNAAGLDVDAVMAHRKERGGLLDYAGAQSYSDPGACFAFDCDVLVPAALEGQIHKGNAATIRAKIVAEGANGPVTPQGEAILRERGTLVIPDIYCNAGGVTVSYFEWLKNLNHVSFGRIAVSDSQGASGARARPRSRGELEYVRAGLADTMALAYREIRELWRSRNIPDLRTAAYVLAIDKIASIYESQGIFP